MDSDVVMMKCTMCHGSGKITTYAYDTHIERWCTQCGGGGWINARMWQKQQKVWDEAIKAADSIARAYQLERESDYIAADIRAAADDGEAG